MTDYSISNLIRNEFFCQNYKAFNDPFECWFILKEGIPFPEKEPERFNQICKAWGYFPDETKESLDDYYLYMEELESYQPDIQRFVERAKITCFSKELDNLLMWSHYADGMRGFCIEFDEKLLLSIEVDKNAAIIPVRYVKQPPFLDKMLFSMANDQIWYHEMALEEEPSSKYKSDYKKALKDAKGLLNNLYQLTIATKPIQWKYEKECRLVFDSEHNTGEFFKFPEDIIKSIIFGERMTSKDIETLSKIIDFKRLSIEKKIAIRNNNSYNMKFENL